MAYRSDTAVWVVIRRTISIRKVNVSVASLGQGLALCLFGRAFTPQTAALCYGMSNFFSAFHGSGYNPNYMEVPTCVYQNMV
jgi:hypothetical protein